MNVNLNVNKYTLLVYIILLQYLVYFGYFTTKNYIFLAVYFFFGLIVLMMAMMEKINLKFLTMSVFGIILFTLFSILSPEAEALLDLYNFLYGLISVAVAYFLYQNKNTYKGVIFVFWAYFLYILYFIFSFGFNDMDAYNDIFAGSSRNYVSAILLFISVLLYLSLYQVNKSVSLIYPILTLFATVALAGRSGLALSSILLLYFLMLSKEFKYLKLILLVIGIFIVFYNMPLILNFMETKTSFNQGLDSPRYIKNREYMTGIFDNLDFIIGRKIDSCCTTIVFYERNPHNSFVMGHLRYGIIHTIFVLLAFLYVLVTRNLFLIMMALVLYVRAFLDTILFFTAFDVVFFYLLFLSYSLHTKKGAI